MTSYDLLLCADHYNALCSYMMSYYHYNGLLPMIIVLLCQPCDAILSLWYFMSLIILLNDIYCYKCHIIHIVLYYALYTWCCHIMLNYALYNICYIMFCDPQSILLCLMIPYVVLRVLWCNIMLYDVLCSHIVPYEAFLHVNLLIMYYDLYGVI